MCSVAVWRPAKLCQSSQAIWNTQLQIFSSYLWEPQPFQRPFLLSRRPKDGIWPGSWFAPTMVSFCRIWLCQRYNLINKYRIWVGSLLIHWIRANGLPNACVAKRCSKFGHNKKRWNLTTNDGIWTLQTPHVHKLSFEEEMDGIWQLNDGIWLVP